ncbi:MAG: ATP-binding protein [Pseudomonadota bacterium]
MSKLLIEGQSLAWLLAAATDAMLIADAQGVIVLANPALERLFGIALEQLVGQPVETLIPARLRQRHGQLRADYAHEPRMREMGAGAELSGLRGDGTEFAVEVSLSPLASGSESLVLATIHDVSRRKAADLRNAALLQEISSANEELTNFAYVVSHDLKAPLRGIGSLADWLATDYAHLFNDEGKEHMRLLLNRVHRMNSLIDGILQYSRVGRVRETRQPVDLNQVLAGVALLLGPPQAIALVIAPGLPTVNAEPTRIEQLFQNLVSNAINYMDKPQGLVEVGFDDGGHEWRFYVRDNGPGIEQRHFERIFQLFQTLATRDRVDSTGVGLALARKIVEMYRGRIWVESVFGAGTTFWFTLPKQHPPTGIDHENQ